MSSSKVYKQSSSFLPEKILKNRVDEDLGWNSTKFTDSEPPHYSPSPIYQENLNPPTPPTHASRPSSNQPEIQDPLEEIINKKNTPQEPHRPKGTSSQSSPPPPEAQSVDANEKAKKLIEDAYKKGIADGILQAEEDYKTGISTLLAISEQLNTTREIILQNSIEEMQDLVLTIAEKIIRHSITAQDDTIVATVEDAIRQTIKSDEFYVCVNQQDYDIINDKSADLIAQISGLDNIVIKIDNSIEPGGCKVESDFCTVDATIASQLQIVTNQVKSRR